MKIKNNKIMNIYETPSEIKAQAGYAGSDLEKGEYVIKLKDLKW